MNKYFEYLKYVLEHKKNIFKVCWKRRMYLHAFTHDMSKFSWIEFKAYAECFYGEKDCSKCKHYMQCDLNQIGIGSGPFAKECSEYRHKDLSFAWDHHVLLNKHHWQHWTYNLYDYYASDNPELKYFKLKQPKSIPDKHLRQMICDWTAMGMKFNNSAQWYYLTKYNEIEMEEDSRMRLEFMLGLNDSMICNYGHTLRRFKSDYTKEQFNVHFGYIKETYGVDAYEAIEK